MAPKTAAAKDSPEAQLRAYVARFDPAQQKLIRAVRSAMRKRLPTANELVYDYGTSLVLSYSPTEEGWRAVAATSARADEMRLYLLHKKPLPDPKKLLQGKAKQTRFLVLDTARRLTHPDVEALLAAAIAQAEVPLPAEGRGGLFVKSDGAKRQARGRTAKAKAKPSAQKKAKARTSAR